MIEDVKWKMEDIDRRIEDEGWRIENGDRRMEDGDGGWRMEDGWRMQDGGCRMKDEGWGTWQASHPPPYLIVKILFSPFPLSFHLPQSQS